MYLLAFLLVFLSSPKFLSVCPSASALSLSAPFYRALTFLCFLSYFFQCSIFSFSCAIFLPSTFARTSISKNTSSRVCCSASTCTSTANNLNNILSNHSNRAATKIAKDVEPLHFSNMVTSVNQRTEFGLQSTRQRRERSSRGNRSASSVDTPTCPPAPASATAAAAA